MKPILGKRGVKFVAILLALVALIALSSPLWFPRLGSFLVVEDKLEKADVIAVLGGGDPQRAKVAADIYKDKWSRRVVATGELVPDFAYAIGKPVTFAQITAKLLDMNGVPPRHIQVLEEGASTFDEAKALKIFMNRNRYDSLIVVTSIYHTRRARAVFRKELKGSGIKLIVRPAEGGKFKLDKWWTREDDLVFVNNEYVKLILYFLKGRI